MDEEPKEKTIKFHRYSDEECADMIRTNSYPADAPAWVIKAIRERRRQIESQIKPPEEEMEDFMKEMGGSKRVE